MHGNDVEDINCDVVIRQFYVNWTKLTEKMKRVNFSRLFSVFVFSFSFPISLGVVLRACLCVCMCMRWENLFFITQVNLFCMVNVCDYKKRTINVCATAKSYTQHTPSRTVSRCCFRFYIVSVAIFSLDSFHFVGWECYTPSWMCNVYVCSL